MGPCRVDARAIAASALVLPPNTPTETPFEGVEIVWPESRSMASPEPPPRSAAYAPSFLRRALERAVDRSLVGVRRVAVLAGGGVDSSALLALTVQWARRTGGSAFAVALDYEAEGDDRPYLRALAAHLACDVVRVRPEDAAPRIAHLHAGVDAAPFTWPVGACEVELMARAREAGAERVLTGVGGDELFDGEPRSLARVARAGRPLRAIGAARRMRGFERPFAPALSWVLRPLLVELVPRALRTRRARRGLQTAPSWAGPTLLSVVREQADATARRLFEPRRDGDDRFRELTARPHRLSIAWLRHQEETASGIARHDPYLDVDLVRAVTSLPPEWLVAGARRRGLLRDAMRDAVPDYVRERQDKAFFEPALERFAAAAGGLGSLSPLTQADCLAELGIVKKAEFAEAASAFLARPEAEEWLRVWPTLACEAFLRARDASRRAGA